VTALARVEERAEQVVLVDGLAVRFGDVEAVAGISFDVAAGEAFGLLGPNGAGKTTTFGMVVGLIGADRGRVLLDQDELRTCREPFPEPHARADAESLRSCGHRAEQRLRSGHRRQRGWTQGEARLLPQGRPQLEAGDEETGDHGNVCSTRTHVLLSTAKKSYCSLGKMSSNRVPPLLPR